MTTTNPQLKKYLKAAKSRKLDQGQFLNWLQRADAAELKKTSNVDALLDIAGTMKNGPLIPAILEHLEINRMAHNLCACCVGTDIDNEPPKRIQKRIETLSQHPNGITAIIRSTNSLPPVSRHLTTEYMEAWKQEFIKTENLTGMRMNLQLLRDPSVLKPLLNDPEAQWHDLIREIGDSSEILDVLICKEPGAIEEFELDAEQPKDLLKLVTGKQKHPLDRIQPHTYGLLACTIDNWGVGEYPCSWIADQIGVQLQHEPTKAKWPAGKGQWHSRADIWICWDERRAWLAEGEEGDLEEIEEAVQAWHMGGNNVIWINDTRPNGDTEEDSQTDTYDIPALDMWAWLRIHHLLPRRGSRITIHTNPQELEAKTQEEWIRMGLDAIMHQTATQIHEEPENLQAVTAWLEELPPATRHAAMPALRQKLQALQNEILKMEDPQKSETITHFMRFWRESGSTCQCPLEPGIIAHQL